MPASARQRALQRLILSPVGLPPDMHSESVDLAALAPPAPESYTRGAPQEGVVRERFENPDEPDPEVLLRQRAAIGNLMADLGESSSRAIEGLTGAQGADIYKGQRDRASEPLKEYMRAREKAATPGALGKPAKSTDPASPASMRWRAVFKQMFPSEDDTNITEANAETAIKYLTAQRGQMTSAGNAAAGISMQQKKLEQDAQQWAERRGLLWADMSLDERKLAESIAAREQAAATKKEEQIAGATKDFGEAVDKTGAPKFYQQHDEAQAILKKYPKDVPGIGRVDGRLPDEQLSPDGRQMRFLVGQLLSEYRKGQTGAGMSDAERAEYGQITGLLNSGNDGAIRQGLDTLKRAIDARVKGLAGAYRPEGVEAYGQRVPSVGNVVKPPPKRTTPQKSLPKDEAGNLTLEGPSPATTKKYSKSKDTTFVFDASGNVIRTEKGDTRG